VTRVLAFALFIAAVFMQGCQSVQAEYVIEGSSTSRLSRDAAQQLLVQNFLQAQVQARSDRPIKVLRLTLPPYPEDLMRAGVEGRTKVRFVIGHDGSVEQAQLAGPSLQSLAELSLNAVRQWKFEPVTRDGMPIRLMLNYEFVFILE